MAIPTTGPAVAQRVFRLSVSWVLLANLAGFVVVSVYLNVVSPDPISTREFDATLAWTTSAAYIATAIAIGLVLARRSFTPIRRYLEHERPPTEEERRVTLAFPFFVTKIVFGAWIIGAALVTAVVLVDRSFGTIQMGIGMVVGGLTTALLALLLLERSFRPVYALALAAEALSSPGRLGIRPRLLLVWALGSGVPLSVLVVASMGGSVSLGHLRALNWFFGSIGLVVGALLVVIAARSISEPVQDLRRAAREVEQGSLDTTVSVNDGGEVGMLQAAFNHMVAGLRERARLHDLFGRHVGHEVARAALERGVELGGESRDASVLFVDLIGSTALARSTSPHAVVDLLNQFFAAVVHTTGVEGGWVNKFEGDAALCVFGAPNALADHRAAALRSARSLRKAVEELTQAHSGFDAAIGVSSGEVVAGNVGAADRSEYTVIGDPVNEASRLTDLAKRLDGRVAVSGSTVEGTAADREAWRCDRNVRLRGRDVETRVFVPTG